MAVTYEKTLWTLQIFFDEAPESMILTDTTTENPATQAWEQAKAGQDILVHATGEEDGTSFEYDLFIPYHAINMITRMVASTATITKPDDENCIEIVKCPDEGGN